VTRAGSGVAIRRAMVAVLAALVLGGCPFVPLRPPESPSLHLHELAGDGDATRRASLGLVLQGLDADARSDARRAQGLYARALQIDSGNPYAYLALARHHVAQRDSERALDHLVRARDLLDAYELMSPRVEVHVVGLRGNVLRLEGREIEAREYLARAARTAPAVWGDAALSADELR